jgi:hypothetical protein
MKINFEADNEPEPEWTIDQSRGSDTMSKEHIELQISNNSWIYYN